MLQSPMSPQASRLLVPSEDTCVSSLGHSLPFHQLQPMTVMWALLFIVPFGSLLSFPDPLACCHTYFWASVFSVHQSLPHSDLLFNLSFCTWTSFHLGEVDLALKALPSLSVFSLPPVSSPQWPRPVLTCPFPGPLLLVGSRSLSSQHRAPFWSECRC